MDTIDMSDVFEEKKKFYSKNAIAISTFILSPIMGCILFAYNLKEMGKGRLAPVFILLSFIWAFAVRKLLSYITSSAFLQLYITNLLASLLLTFLIWNKFLGDDTEYESRPVWKPISIFVGICIALLAFNFFGGEEDDVYPSGL
jgi:hypothetical protein